MCYACRRTIGRYDKWYFDEGKAKHKDCKQPKGSEPVPNPQRRLIEEGQK